MIYYDAHVSVCRRASVCRASVGHVNAGHASVGQAG